METTHPGRTPGRYGGYRGEPGELPLTSRQSPRQPSAPQARIERRDQSAGYLTDDAAWLDSLHAAVAWDRGDIQTAIATNERLLTYYQEGGDQAAIAGQLHHLGEARRDLGEYEQAERELRAADLIYRELGDDLGLVNNSHSLADLALDRGNYAQAIEIYHATMTDWDRARQPPGQDTDAGETGRNRAYCLAGIASALAATGHDTVAAELWGAVCSAEQTLGFRMLRSERKRYETHLTRFEGTESWRQGRTLSLKQATEKLGTIAAVTSSGAGAGCL